MPFWPCNMPFWKRQTTWLGLHSSTKNIVHTKHFYKSCFDKSNGWKTAKYDKTMTYKDNQMLNWCLRLRPDLLCSMLNYTGLLSHVAGNPICVIWLHTPINHLVFSLHHIRPLVSCGIGGPPTCWVWPHIPQTHLVSSYYYTHIGEAIAYIEVQCTWGSSCYDEC